MNRPVYLAIIGAGTFARNGHLPALLALGPQVIRVKAIHSRSETSAIKLAGLIPYPVDIETDLDVLLAHPEIDAVDIVVPVPELPAVIERALASGKHMISEKPIAADSTTGKALIARQQAGQVWMVAENRRYHPTFRQAADLIRNGEVGRPLLAHYVAHNPITPESEYFQAQWRQTSSHPGGMLLREGVHHAASLRMALGEIKEVEARTARMGSVLVTPDTLVANLQFESGLLGHLALTYATGPAPSLSFAVRAEGGEINVSQRGITIRHGDDEQLTLEASGGQDIKAELAAFVRAILNDESHVNTPQEALQDLAVMEAILRAAETHVPVAVEQVIAPLLPA